MSIVRGDTLIDNAVLQINVFLCRHPNIRNENNNRSGVEYFHSWEYYLPEILNVSPPARKLYLRESYHFTSRRATVCDFH